ncbi:integrase [Putridiphycobacter roseus]|uniref:Integrase n=1 Tax=Putridiphycobacter roseus TaxID=2219161 RepID=A0A2W1NFX6_9FLAO|nr:tyrosine-type recombinase/integrase [Putridiphycobacter roseus]PZE16936.1 integrase [Putridiphycobacter roseus]
MLESFLHYLTYEKRFSAHTVVAYENDVKQFYEVLNLEDHMLADLTHRDIRGYLVELVDMNHENTTINRKLSSLKTFFKFLKREEKIMHNPMVKIQGLKQKKMLPQFVPENQLWDKSTFDEYDDPFLNLRDELILELFYQTGIRLSELINLKSNQYQSTQIKVIGKRNKERIIPVASPLKMLIDEYLLLRLEKEVDMDFLINGNKGKKLESKFVYSKVNYYLSKVTNLKKRSPHVLRHTFATHMLNNGASLESIKSILGHTDLTATQVYTHNSFKQIKNIYKSAHPRGGD